MRFMLLVLGCLALTAASCGGDDDDDAASEPGPTLVTPDKPGEPEELWRFETREFDQVLVDADAELVVATSAPEYPQLHPEPERWVIGIDPADGSERWRVTLECTPYQPVLDGEAVYFACGDGTVRALDRDNGAELWDVNPGTAPYVPVLAGDLLLLGDADPEMYGLSGTDPPDPPGAWAGKLVALDATTGDEVWRIDEGRGAMLVTSAGSVAYVLATATKADLLAIDVATGDEQWRAPAASGQHTPFVTDKTVYVPLAIGQMIAIDRATGDEHWRVDVPGGGTFESPVRIGDIVVAGTNVHSLYGLNAVDGSVAWEMQYCDCGYHAQPFGSTVLVWGPGVFFLDAATGDRLAFMEFERPPLHPAVVGPRIYVGTMGGALFAYDVSP